MFEMKRTGICVLVASMMVCAVACDENGISIIPSEMNITSEQIISAAKEYSKALVDLDTNKIISLSSSLSEDNIEFLETFSFDGTYGEESAPVYEAYFATISYEVLEDTVVIDGDKSSVNVRFRYVDYYSVEPDSHGVDGWLNAINSSEDYYETDIKFNVELKHEGDKDVPVIKNANKVINKYFFDEVANVYFYVETFVFYDDVVDISLSKDTYEATDTIRVNVAFASDNRPDNKEVLVSVFDKSMNPIYEDTVVYGANEELSFTVDAEDLSQDYLSEGFYSVAVEALDGSIYTNKKMYVKKFVEPTFDVGVFDGLYEADLISYSKPDRTIMGSYSKADGEYVNEFFDVVMTVPEPDSVYNARKIVNSKVINDIPYSCALALVPKDSTDMECYVLVTDIDKEIMSAQDLSQFFEMNGADVVCEGGMFVGENNFLYVARSTYLMEVIPEDEEIVVDPEEGEDETAEATETDSTDVTDETSEDASTETEETEKAEEIDATESSEVDESEVTDETEVTSESEVTDETSADGEEITEPEIEPEHEYIEKSVTYLIKYKEGKLFIIEFVGDSFDARDEYITSVRSIDGEVAISDSTDIFEVADIDVLPDVSESGSSSENDEIDENDESRDESSDVSSNSDDNSDATEVTKTSESVED